MRLPRLACPRPLTTISQCWTGGNSLSPRNWWWEGRMSISPNLIFCYQMTYPREWGTYSYRGCEIHGVCQQYSAQCQQFNIYIYTIYIQYIYILYIERYVNITYIFRDVDITHWFTHREEPGLSSSSFHHPFIILSSSTLSTLWRRLPGPLASRRLVAKPNVPSHPPTPPGPKEPTRQKRSRFPHGTVIPHWKGKCLN